MARVGEGESGWCPGQRGKGTLGRAPGAMAGSLAFALGELGAMEASEPRRRDGLRYNGDWTCIPTERPTTHLSVPFPCLAATLPTYPLRPLNPAPSGHAQEPSGSGRGCGVWERLGRDLGDRGGEGLHPNP